MLYPQLLTCPLCAVYIIRSAVTSWLLNLVTFQSCALTFCWIWQFGSPLPWNSPFGDSVSSPYSLLPYWFLFCGVLSLPRWSFILLLLHPLIDFLLLPLLSQALIIPKIRWFLIQTDNQNKLERFEFLASGASSCLLWANNVFCFPYLHL